MGLLSIFRRFLCLWCVFLVFSTPGVYSRHITKSYPESAKTCGYSACPAYHPHAINIHIIAHSHDDVGWLKTVKDYYEQDVKPIFDSVYEALLANPQRRFNQVETAFFKMWWEAQPADVRSNFSRLVDTGQVEFLNGGWVANDEGATHYESIIDQFTLGLKYLEENFGSCGRPRTGWQIDSFGHSREQASISAQMGFDSLMFARIDFRDKAQRKATTNMEFLWRGSASLGNTSDIFTSVLWDLYIELPCFDRYCAPASGTPQSFAQMIEERLKSAATNNILYLAGGDFHYSMANMNFQGLEGLVDSLEDARLEIGGRKLRFFFSTPTCYTKFVHEAMRRQPHKKLSIKTGDFFPYASDQRGDYWTGYFTSRPASKRFERFCMSFLHAAKQLVAVSMDAGGSLGIETLKEAVAVMQHHDAVSGTEKQKVANDYHFRLSNGLDDALGVVSNIFQNTIRVPGSNSQTFFGSCFLANISSCEVSQYDQFSLVVYNALGRRSSGVVRVPVDVRKWVITNSSGHKVDHQIVEAMRDFTYMEDLKISRYSLEFLAKNLPPLGFEVFHVQRKRTKEVGEDLNPDNIRDTRQTDSVGYKETNFEVDEDGLLSHITMNGVRMGIKQEILFYIGNNKMSTSGAYIFAPRASVVSRSSEEKVETKRISGSLFEGLVQEFNSWAKQTIKVYRDDPTFVELDWVVGPLIIHDMKNAKEVFSRFSTTLNSGSVFYTDSNGRELIKRTRNHRDDYNYTHYDDIAGNYYPVNTRILIRDEEKQLEFAVLTDRSQGGSSLASGQLELMMHRTCTADDEKGVEEVLDEHEYDTKLTVRGKYYLILGKMQAPGKSLALQERQLVQKLTWQPWSFYTQGEILRNCSAFSALKQDLPENVHILTLDFWAKNTILLRLEHMLEKGEDPELSKDVTIDLSEMFSTFRIVAAKETTLGANNLLKDLDRLHWPESENPAGQSQFLDIESRLLELEVGDFKITLAPMQIRTFLLTVEVL